MSFSYKRIALIALILIAAGGGSTYMYSQKKPPESEPIVDVAPLVAVLELQPTRVQFQVDSQGTVQPAVTTSLSAEVAGSIISVSSSFVAGGIFDANETLLQIDPTVYQAAVRQAEAVLNQRQIEYDGIKSLGTKNYRSKIDQAAAAAALEIAKSDVTRSRRDLDKTRVRLPYAGIVREKVAGIGQFVGAGSTLGTTFGTDVLEVRLPLSQNDQRFLNLPQASETGNTIAAVPVTLSGRYRGRETTWSATIVRTEGIIDQTNRVTYAVAQIIDPYRRQKNSPHRVPLPVGTFAGAKIDGLFLDDVLEVPRSAIRGNGQLLFVDDENQLRVRVVDIINSDGKTAYVAANSVTERRLVLTTIEAPVNGQQVRVDGEPDTAPARTSGDGTAASE